MLTLIAVLVGVVFAAWAIARFYLQGEDLSRYDRVHAPAVVSSAGAGQREPSAEYHEVLELLAGLTSAGEARRGRARLEAMREAMDAMGDGTDLAGISPRKPDRPETIRGRLQALSKSEFERVLRGIFEEDEFLLVLLGGVLGATIGLIQAVIMGALRILRASSRRRYHAARVGNNFPLNSSHSSY
jgi:hypothetical protein